MKVVLKSTSSSPAGSSEGWVKEGMERNAVDVTWQMESWVLLGNFGTLEVSIYKCVKSGVFIWTGYKKKNVMGIEVYNNQFLHKFYKFAFHTALRDFRKFPP